MNIIQNTIIKGYKALIVKNDTIILYKCGKLFLFKNGKIEFLIEVKGTKWLDRFRITNRLFRREPKYAKEIFAGGIILVWNRHLYLVDLNKNSIQIVSNSREGFSDPLNVCIPHKMSKYIAIWGDYGSNLEHQEVRIYGLDNSYNVEIIYTFAAGTIRHIHNIIPKLEEGYYIFTGDTEEQAGIYEITENFDKVIPIAVGKQKYRAVVGFETVEGLLYATDAVNEKNYIYLLQKDKVKEITAINGSCIYGTRYGGGFMFSTVVEPDEQCNGLKSWFSYKRGRGILSNSVDLIMVDKEFNSKILISYDKDMLPMKLFQYGSIQFPSEEKIQADNSLFAIYPVAVKKYDGDTVVFNMR